jgi:SulP family sulfate permease
VIPKIFFTLRGYSLAILKQDVVAGITVALVAFPLSIGLSVASGARPEAGLVTVIVAGFFISLLGGSRVQIGGPTGAFIVVVYDIISTHGFDGLILATSMAGLLLIFLALFRVGNFINRVPETVISGFTLGIGVIIAASQLKDALGLRFEAFSSNFLGQLALVFNHLNDIRPTALVMSIGTIALIILVKQKFPRTPGLFVVVVLISGLTALLSIDVSTLGDRFGDIKTVLSLPKIPSLELNRVVELFPSATIIALLSGVESLLSAKVADRLVGDTHRPNAEIMAQGVANFVSPMFGGLPATGAIARTATNIQAGGTTPIAGIVHAIVVLLIVMGFSAYAAHLALPVLAGLILLVAWNMCQPDDTWRQLVDMDCPQRVVFSSTFLVTLLVGLAEGVLVGILLSWFISRFLSARF